MKLDGRFLDFITKENISFVTLVELINSVKFSKEKEAFLMTGEFMSSDDGVKTLHFIDFLCEIGLLEKALEEHCGKCYTSSGNFKSIKEMGNWYHCEKCNYVTVLSDQHIVHLVKNKIWR